MASRSASSQQVLVEEIQAFVQALQERGTPQLASQLREYVYVRTAGEGEAPADAAQGATKDGLLAQAAGTESFLNRLNYLVTRDAAPWEAREPIVRLLLEADAAGKLLDVYHNRKAGGELPAMEALERSLKKYAAVHLDSIFQRYRSGDAAATGELLKLFTDSSFEIVKFLFEESERRFLSKPEQGGDLLPEIVVRLEERMFQGSSNDKEGRAILDRLSYLLARLPVETLRRIDEQARIIKDEKSIAVKLRPFQRERVTEYLQFLQSSLPEVQRAPSIAVMLARINEKKAVINGWDKMLMLCIDVRLGLKQYHNALTQDLLRRSREVDVDVAELLRRSPTADGARLVAELHHALDVGMPITAVVEKAVLAEDFLKSMRRQDAPAERLHAEALDRVKKLEARFLEAFASFDRVIGSLRSLAEECNEMERSYKPLLVEDEDLVDEIGKLRGEVQERLQAGMERLKLPSPNDTNRVLVRAATAETPAGPAPVGAGEPAQSPPEQSGGP